MCAQLDRGLPGDIETYLKSLKRTLGSIAVVLFGSRATDSQNLRSDCDLMVIADGLPIDFWERQEFLWRGKPSSVDAIGLTREEVRQMINRGLILDALLQGRVIHGDISELTDLARTYVEKSGLVRTPAGYVHI